MKKLCYLLSLAVLGLLLSSCAAEPTAEPVLLTAAGNTNGNLQHQKPSFSQWKDGTKEFIDANIYPFPDSKITTDGIWDYYFYPRQGENWGRLYKQDVTLREQILLHVDTLAEHTRPENKYLGNGRSNAGPEKVNLNVMGEWLYYSKAQWEITIGEDVRDYTFGIYRMKTDGGPEECLFDEYVHGLAVGDDWLYFMNDADMARPYKMKTDGSAPTKLADTTQCYALNLTEKYMYWLQEVQDKAGNYSRLFRLPYGVKQPEEVAIPHLLMFMMIIDGDDVYYSDAERNTILGNIYRWKIDDRTQPEMILRGSDAISLADFNVLDGERFYTARETETGDSKLHKIDRTGADTVLATGLTLSRSFQVAQNRVYFFKHTDGADGIDELYCLYPDQPEAVLIYPTR